MSSAAQIEPAVTKLGCTICGGSFIASKVAENHDLLVGGSAIVGAVVAVVGLYLQWRQGRGPK